MKTGWLIICPYICSIAEDQMKKINRNDEIRGLDFLLSVRALKEKFLDPKWLEGPGWDILINLYKASMDSDSLSAEELCRYTDYTSPTLTRYLEYFTKSGMIEKSVFPLASHTFAPYTTVSLTDIATRRMSDLLRELHINSQIR